MSLSSDTIAFLVWRHCEPLGWDCTLRDVADALGVSVGRVRGVAQHRGWLNRFRAGSYKHV